MADRYVDPATGSDDNPGTEAEPYATLTKAAQTAVAGDTIWAKPGTYKETVQPSNSGTVASPIQWKRWGDTGTVHVTGSDDGGTTRTRNYALSLSNKYNHHFHDFEASYTVQELIYIANAQGVEFYDCYFHHAAATKSMMPASSLNWFRFTRCRFEGTATCYYAITLEAYHGLIEDCVFYGFTASAAAAVRLMQGCVNIEVKGCRFYNNYRGMIIIATLGINVHDCVFGFDESENSAPNTYADIDITVVSQVTSAVQLNWDNVRMGGITKLKGYVPYGYPHELEKTTLLALSNYDGSGGLLAWTAAGYAVPDTTVSYDEGGTAWKFVPGLTAWPMILPLNIPIAVESGVQTTFTIRCRRNTDYGTDHLPSVRLKGCGVDETYQPVAMNADTWVQFTVSGTPTRDGYVEVFLSAQKASDAGANPACWWDDWSVETA